MNAERDLRAVLARMTGPTWPNDGITALARRWALEGATRDRTPIVFAMHFGRPDRWTIHRQGDAQRTFERADLLGLSLAWLALHNVGAEVDIGALALPDSKANRPDDARRVSRANAARAALNSAAAWVRDTAAVPQLAALFAPGRTIVSETRQTVRHVVDPQAAPVITRIV